MSGSKNTNECITMTLTHKHLGATATQPLPLKTYKKEYLCALFISMNIMLVHKIFNLYRCFLVLISFKITYQMCNFPNFHFWAILRNLQFNQVKMFFCFYYFNCILKLYQLFTSYSRKLNSVVVSQLYSVLEIIEILFV